ncbi:MAG: type II toxin-antitoxin system PemK/MazF family toxin [Devosia sp.]
MPTFEAGDVVRVPFPYTNRETSQHRPAVVVSNGALGSGMFLWVVMVTSEGNRSWPGDVSLGTDYGDAGLPAPSRVRTLKIATIETTSAQPIGKLGAYYLRQVQAELGRHLNLSP